MLSKFLVVSYELSLLFVIQRIVGCNKSSELIWIAMYKNKELSYEIKP